MLILCLFILQRNYITNLFVFQEYFLFFADLAWKVHKCVYDDSAGFRTLIKSQAIWCTIQATDSLLQRKRDTFWCPFCVVRFIGVGEQKCYLSAVCIADISSLCGIKCKIADWCNQGINTKRDYGEKEICKCSWSVSLGLKAGVINYEASYPTKKKCKKKACKILCTHYIPPK